MSKEVLTISVRITGADQVKGKKAEALMLHFDGRADCENFKGIILPGGVDTQKEIYGQGRNLSARYVLEGKDYTGKDCKIFIENNGEVKADGSVETKPIIFTDSDALSFLEAADLKGTITPADGGVTIHIWMEE